MNKKVISALLAGVMSLSTLGTSVFAATGDDKGLSAAGQTTFKISAAVAAPVIDVTVPSSISAAINPYGVEITVKGGSTLGAGGVSSANYVIVNKTLTSAIKVKATPTLTVPTTKDKDGKLQNSWIVEEDPENADAVKTATDKTMYAEVMGFAIDEAKVANNAQVIKLPDYTQADWNSAANVNHLPFLDATVNATRNKDAAGLVGKTAELIVLPKAEPKTEKDDDKGIAASDEKYGYGVIAISGVISETDDWTTKDKVSLNLVLDIGPCAAPTVAP